MTDLFANGLAPAPPGREPVVAGVVLAAGASSRIGVPKALLPFNDRTFVENLAELLREAGVDPLYVVVSGANREEIRGRLPRWVRVTVNDHPERGQISSLQAGLHALGGVGAAALVALVDQPTLAPETLRALLATWIETRAGAVVPRHREERGHPVVLARSIFPAVYRAVGRETLRDILEARSEEVVEVEIDDPRVLLNVNTPADYRRLIDRYGLPHEKHLGDAWQGYIATKSRSGRE